jgi:HAD superfamily hydrolase (TIGR01490 family)
MNSRTNGAPKAIAAFFDLDGTLLPAPSLEWRFFAWLLAQNEMSPRQIGGWFAQFARRCFRNPHAATEGNKAYLAGVRESLTADWENSLPPRSLAPFVRGLQRIRWHLAQGHRVFFVSGTLEPLARVVARRVAKLAGEASSQEFPVQIEVCAAQLAVRDGRWTGDIAGEHCSGEAKARAIRALAEENGIDLSRSFAYGNGIADLSMLAAVGYPVAVNPSTRLERAARVQGWKICDWKEISSPPRSLARASSTQWLSPDGAR